GGGRLPVPATSLLDGPAATQLGDRDRWAEAKYRVHRDCHSFDGRRVRGERDSPEECELLETAQDHVATSGDRLERGACLPLRPELATQVHVEADRQARVAGEVQGRRDGV